MKIHGLAVTLASPVLAGPVRCQTHHEPTSEPAAPPVRRRHAGGQHL